MGMTSAQINHGQNTYLWSTKVVLAWVGLGGPLCTALIFFGYFFFRLGEEDEDAQDHQWKMVEAIKDIMDLFLIVGTVLMCGVPTVFPIPGPIPPPPQFLAPF